MKVWTKVHIKDKNKLLNLISKAFTNYLYTYGPILNLFRKILSSLLCINMETSNECLKEKSLKYINEFEF